MNTEFQAKERYSSFAEKFLKPTGIKQLMDDIASFSDRKTIMLGGGNPARIDKVYDFFSNRVITAMGCRKEYSEALESYSSPQGDADFISALAEMMNAKMGLDVKEENIALTCGSQSSFYMLFNALAGKRKSGKKKKILFPLSPEYIGYQEAMFEENCLASFVPETEIFEEERMFKYHIDFNRLTLTDDVGAVCVSRPTNPTGNVITDSELGHLDNMAKEKGVPLIIDNAYGAPFPNLIFKPAKLLWNENVILCMSLSKLGLPAWRVGIIIAEKRLIQMICSMNAVLTLAPTSFGAKMAAPLLRDGSLLELCKKVIVPHYQKKSEYASATLINLLKGYDCLLHKNEGAFFLWLWMRNLPISSMELYQKLKNRGVIVIPGEYFFPGLNDPFVSNHKCIRINYAVNDEDLNSGLSIIAEEIKKAYRKEHS